MFDATFWVGAAFVVFILAVWRPASRKFKEALDSRSDKIRDELDEAVRLREEAQTLFARYQRMQSDSIKQAEEILAHAREEAERQSKQGAEALAAALARRESQAIDRIARAEQEALAEVRGVAVDLAVKATQKLLEDRLDEERQAALVDAAVADLDKKLH